MILSREWFSNNNICMPGIRYLSENDLYNMDHNDLYNRVIDEKPKYISDVAGFLIKNNVIHLKIIYNLINKYMLYSNEEVLKILSQVKNMISKGRIYKTKSITTFFNKLRKTPSAFNGELKYECIYYLCGWFLHRGNKKKGTIGVISDVIGEYISLSQNKERIKCDKEVSIFIKSQMDKYFFKE